MNVDQVADRVYPNSTLAGNVIGFVNSNGVGLAGLEASLDPRLTGTAGSETYERGRKGQAIPGGYPKDTPATAGRLGAAHARLRHAVEGAVGARRPGRRDGLGLRLARRAWTSKTGEIYALADSGTRRPEPPGRGVGLAVQRRLGRVRAGLDGQGHHDGRDPREQASPTRCRSGRCRTSTRPTNNQTFKDSHEHGVLQLTTTGVLAESSNTGTVMIGQDLPVADAVRLPGEVRVRRQDRHRDAGGVHRHPAPGRRLGRPHQVRGAVRPGACPSPRSRPPRCSRRSPTAASGSSRTSSRAGRRRTGRTRPRDGRRDDAGGLAGDGQDRAHDDAERRRRRHGRQRRDPRLPGGRQDRHRRRTGSTASRASRPRSSASRPRTTRGSSSP